MPNTILIVDDSSMVRRYVRQALEAMELAVLEAADGPTALALVERERPALVISDVNMAPMNGFELLETLRKHYTRQELPILMLTTEADDAMKVRGKQAGANGWLVKPFDPARMNAVVKHLLTGTTRPHEGRAR